MEGEDVTARAMEMKKIANVLASSNWNYLNWRAMESPVAAVAGV